MLGPQPRQDGVGIDACRQCQAIAILRERARQHDVRPLELIEADHRARADADVAADPVRLALEHGPDHEIGLTDPQRIADLQPEPGEQAAFDHDAPIGERLVQAQARRIEHGRAVQRIGGIDRLERHHHAPAAATFGHGVGAHARRAPGARRGQPGELGRGQRQVAGIDLEVAAEQRRGVPLQAVDQARVEHADHRDRGDPEGQAGEEHGEAAEPAAQLPAREPPGEHEPPHAPPPAASGCRRRPACAGSDTRPSAISSRRSQRAARAGSWVISNRVMPRSRWTRNSSSTISWPVS